MDINVPTDQCIALITQSITNAILVNSLEKSGALVIPILNEQLIKNALFSGFFAGVVAIGATVALERFGGVLGGILAAIPTTIVPASIGFWLNSDGPGFRAALYSVPLGMLLNAVFLHVWRWLPSKVSRLDPGKQLVTMVLSSLLVWLCCALFTVVVLDIFSWALAWIGFAALIVQFVYGRLGARMVQPKAASVAPVPILVLLLRGSMASCAIFLASIIVATGHSTLAGVASVFPAIFLTVMVSVWLSQGPAIPSQAAGPMMLGSTSVSVYALISIFSFPIFGVALGALFAWVFAILCVSFPVHRILRGDQAHGMGSSRESIEIKGHEN